MENASSPSDVSNNLTTYSLEDDDRQPYSDYVGDLAVNIIRPIIGTVGVLDNLFVIITFALFVKITDKVRAILEISLNTFVCLQLRAQMFAIRGKFKFNNSVRRNALFMRNVRSLA